jgi:hypothetical protein
MGLGEMYEGAPEIFAHVNVGLSGVSRMRRPGCEDPQWRMWKFLFI